MAEAGVEQAFFSVCPSRERTLQPPGSLHTRAVAAPCSIHSVIFSVWAALHFPLQSLLKGEAVMLPGVVKVFLFFQQLQSMLVQYQVCCYCRKKSILYIYPVTNEDGNLFGSFIHTGETLQKVGLVCHNDSFTAGMSNR